MVSLAQKDKYRMTSLICGAQNILMEAENRMVVPRGWEGDMGTWGTEDKVAVMYNE